MSYLAKNALTNAIKQKASELGFSACGVVQAGFLEDDSKRLRKWLDENRHADMQYMENHFEKRTDPRLLFEQAKSIIIVLFNYFPRKPLPEAGSFKISRYAYGKDYHFVMKSRLKELISAIRTIAPNSHSRAFVDSAPVLERAWAQKAGLGWIGKNTCLITNDRGSYFFIGEIITDIELVYENHPVPDNCGGCRRCMEACPTGALDIQGLNAGRCISYWTIEYQGSEIPEQLQGKFNDWIFGCDICQEVCPWNRLSDEHNEPQFDPSDNLASMKKDDWRVLSKESFNELFRNSPLKRAKFEGLTRNIRFVGKEI